jgi:DNA repair protein RecO (recombination protein O)
MKQIVTSGIVLTRTNFGEAARILTVLTPDHGKRHLMAKGVRRVRSKLAGGIELFSVSNITFIPGRGDIDTLISTRLVRHYGNIVSNIQRVQLGYELIKLLNRVTEDNLGGEYFMLLDEAFRALDDVAIDDDLIRTWFYAQLLRTGGHSPNLRTTLSGEVLDINQSFNFNFENMTFMPQVEGWFKADHIKFLRLVFSDNRPATLQKIRDISQLLTVCSPIVQTMLNTYVQV